MKYEESREIFLDWVKDYIRSQSDIDMALKYIETAETEGEACTKECNISEFWYDFRDEDDVQFTKKLKEFIGLIG